jgi:hypothetical protein
MDLPYDIACASKEVQDHYRACIADGQSPRFSEMVSLGIAPGTLGSDRAFQQGRLDGNWLDQLPTKQARRMLREAKSAGISTEGKYYMSGLANASGHRDPAAWVSDRADVLKVAKERRLELKGAVNYTPSDPAPRPQPKGLNPRLVSELAKKEMARDPGLTKAAAAERIRKNHTPHWARNR